MTTTPRRTGRQREAVAAFLEGESSFRSAQSIHGELREQGSGIGLATVYRALQGLGEDQQGDALRTDAGEVVSRRCSRGHHHHHLVCRECGRTVEVEGPAVERWATRVAEEH